LKSTWWAGVSCHGRAQAKKDEPERSESRLDSLTSKEAAERIEALKGVYDGGYLTWDKYEALKHGVEARVERD